MEGCVEFVHELNLGILCVSEGFNFTREVDIYAYIGPLFFIPAHWKGFLNGSLFVSAIKIFTAKKY